MKFLNFIDGLFIFVVLSVASCTGYVGYAGWVVDRWDQKIEALCAANGGADVATRVYETALAPETPEYFRGSKPFTGIGVIERREGFKYGPEYPFVIETRVIEVLHEKDPSVVKHTARLVKVSDNRIMAERFGYQRAGGGIQLWDPGEMRSCPKDRLEDRLEVRVFTNDPQHHLLEKK